MLQVSRLSEDHAKSSKAVGTRQKTMGPCATGIGLLNVSRKSENRAKSLTVVENHAKSLTVL